MTRILLAPDKFKGSLTAAQVAQALAGGLLRARPDLDVVCLPVADGGDGTVEAATSSGFTRVPVSTVGPTGRPVQSAYARKHATAIVELADACGLGRLVDGRAAPLTATSRGLGIVVAAAIDAGCTDVILGIGGSASTDGGAGMLRALGATLHDVHGRDVGEGGGSLAAVATIDTAALRERIGGVTVTVACDVDNPLLGARGAAAVYAPQKGASPDEVSHLESGLRHWADLLATVTGTDRRAEPGAGAAGGVGFGAMALLGATLRPGADLILDLVGLPSALLAADLVITGEGSFDDQTLHGKAPIRVAAMAMAKGVPTYVVCGRCELAPDVWSAAGVAAVFPLSQRQPDVLRSIADAAALLDGVGADIARAVT